MKEEIILNYVKLRSLFDSFSNEFNSSAIDDKLLTLASLNHYGLLKKVILEYRKENKQKGKTGLVKDLDTTLNSFLKHLNPEKYSNSYGEVKLELKRIIEALEIELKLFSEEHFSKEKFIKAHLEKNEIEYKTQKRFFKIDLKKDITDKLSQRDDSEKKEYTESYTHLYNFLQTILIPSYVENNFHIMVEMGCDYQTEYLIRYFLQKPDKESYFEAITYAIDILYFDKAPYHKFVLFRNHFGNAEQIQKFYINDETAIHLNTDIDFEDWERYLNGEMPKQQYLQRWKALTELINKEDVIIIVSYKGIGCTIGNITKGTAFQKVKNGKSIFYLFKLKNVKPIDLKKHGFVQTLIPANTTMSNIHRENYSLRKIFPGIICPTSNSEM